MAMCVDALKLSSEWVKERKSSLQEKGASYWTGTYDAYNIADGMITGDNSQKKNVIILSDGETANCVGSTETDRRNANKEFPIADKWRNNGINIIYVAVASNEYYHNIK
ncbi:VWFA domain-containing protein, partial [Trichostrongylus colubriformis]